MQEVYRMAGVALIAAQELTPGISLLGCFDSMRVARPF